MPRGTKLNRRKVLGALGAVGLGKFAGCIGDSGPDVVDPGGEGEGFVEIDYDDVEMGGTLYTGLSADPPEWDPVNIGDTTSNMVSGATLYEGIMAADYEGKFFPYLAESYEEIDIQDVTEEDYEDYMKPMDEVNPGEFLMAHPDGEQALDVEGGQDAVDDGVFGMGYEFQIHEGIEFHNGEELTADHFPPSYLRWTDSDRWGVEMVPWFLDIRATGDYTVEIYGQLPDADFFQSVSQQVFPEEHWDLEPGAINPIDGEGPIGTGAFQFEAYEEASYVTLSRFDDHWFDPDMVDWDVPDGFPETPPIEEIEFEIIPSDDSRQSALMDGQIDHTYGMESDQLTPLDNDDEFRVSAATSGGYLFFEYPNQQEPWDDPRMCRGVNHLIDRDLLVDEIFNGWSEAAAFPLSPVSQRAGVHDYDEMADELAEYNEHDPEGGQELIEDVFDDYEIDAPFETRIITNVDNSDRVEAVDTIAEIMEGTGLFEVETETYEWGSFVEMLISGTLYQENQIIVVGLSSSWSPDGYARAVSHPDNQHGACCNHTHYEDPEVTELIDSARYGQEVIGEDNLDTRRDRYEELWPALLENPPVSWLTFGMEDDVVRDDVVKGWNAYPFNSSKYSAALYNPVAGQVTWIAGDDDD